MIVSRFIPLILFLATLQGCAYLGSIKSNVEQHVEGLVEQYEYGRALSVLEHIKPTHPSYASLMKLQKEIEKKAAAYERREIDEALKLESKGQWYAALQVFHRTLDRLPDSRTLQKAYNQFYIRRDSRIGELERELLIARGAWLSESLSIHRAFKETAPEKRLFRISIEAWQDESQEVGEQLEKLGLEALRKNDLEMAERTLPLAQKLTPSVTLARANKQLQEELDTQQRQRREASLRKQRSELLKDYHTAMAKHNLKEAQAVIVQLERVDRGSAEVKRLHEELDKSIARVVKRELDAGTAAYSNRQFEKAIKHWRKAQELAPHDETIKANIERARRVLKKVAELEEKQKGEEGAQ